MNIVHNNELTFQQTAFHPVSHAGETWLTSSELAAALGYKKSDAVTQIYSRYHDEFTEKMSTTLKMSVVRKTGVVDIPVRVFSLRGCHLIAMFATTKVAKDFRRWVLDILDREVQHSPIAKQFSDEELVSFCYLQLWMERSQLVSKNLYPAMKQAKSEYAGALYDIAHDIHYMTVETKKILLREAKNLDDKNFVVSHAQPMLAKLRGEDGWIH
ncbi:P22AR C-terminal domain-containing protein [Enterobacter kobei]|uniref:P22AR C-terminal domain-containing protein n=1 Tax=Enterobacter kobei TaxID=208224 RepID=UPI0032AEBA68